MLIDLISILELLISMSSIYIASFDFSTLPPWLSANISLHSNDFLLRFIYVQPALIKNLLSFKIEMFMQKNMEDRVSQKNTRIFVNCVNPLQTSIQFSLENVTTNSYSFIYKWKGEKLKLNIWDIKNLMSLQTT